MKGIEKMVLKRIFDFLLALAGLTVLLPFFGIIAVLVKIKSPGPVFFFQERIGRNGKIFRIIKFRTMVVNHDGVSVSIKGDNRITPLGAWLRKNKLDELPELFNVLKGEMSFVGPRPDVPGYADRLTGEDRKILLLKPGITGPASLKYRNEEELLKTQKDPIKYNDEVIFPDKVKMNLEYFYSRSFTGDVRIILKTILGKR